MACVDLSAVALSYAQAAPDMFCPVTATLIGETTSLAIGLHFVPTGSILTCSNVSRPAFLDAVALTLARNLTQLPSHSMHNCLKATWPEPLNAPAVLQSTLQFLCF